MTFFRQNQMFLIALFAMAFVWLSCQKSADEIADLLSSTEAAEIVESAVSERSGGSTMPTVDMAKLLETYLNNCGVPGDTSLSRTKTAGPVTYTYNFDLGWLVTCNNLNIPQSAAVTVAGNGSFSVAHWSGQDATTGNLTFTGLQPSATAYIVNGTYNLDGDITGNLRKTDPSLECTTAMTLKDLNIRKSDYVVTGGTGTAVITASNGKGRTATINASFVFNGDGTVTVTVNGYTYTFPLK